MRNVPAAASVRVTAEIDVAAPPVAHVRVQLSRPQVGVTQHLLDASQVGSALQEMGREGVAQQVGVDTLGLEARSLGQAPQDQEGARSGERAALRVQEQLRSVTAIEERAAVGEVAPQRLD